MRTILFTVLLILYSISLAQAQSPKAKLVYEIAQGFTWTSFPDDKFTIGIMDEKALASELATFLADKQLGGKSVEIKKFGYNFQVKPCNILFLGASSSANTFIDVMKEKMRGFAGLIVTEKAGMLAEGSHINLVNQGNGLKYEVNRPIVESMGLGINPALLPNAIAKEVEVAEETKTLNLKLPELRRKRNQADTIEEESASETPTTRRKKRDKKATTESPAEEPEEVRLLTKAAAEKGVTDRQTELLREYVRALEGKLDENKIDYLSLKQKFDSEQIKAAQEIDSLNLTIIEKDSLRKKDALLAQRKIALAESEKQLAEAHAQTNWLIALSAGGIAVLLALLAFIFYRDRVIINRQNKVLAESIEQIQQQKEEILAQRDEIEAQKNRIEAESQQSEKLLLNILPAPIAHQLKTTGQATPSQYELASVLFTDFKGFTNIAAEMTPEDIIQELDQCFLAFDEIAERNNLERIKTIGDSYMAAGGVPEANTSNPLDAVQAAIEMQTFMQNRKTELQAQGKPFFECRIGVHSGKIVAGVVGKKKFAYDIWGDTVNLASRMESSGEVNQINISGVTYNLVKDKFQCEYRGKINAKGKGEVDMYFVKG